MLGFSILVLGARGQAAGPVLFEAETAVLARGADRVNDPTASGGSCVRLPKKGGNIAWEVEVSEAGRYDLTLRYRAETGDRAQIIRINGAETGMGFSRTDEGWLETSRSFALAAGRNRIEIAGDWGEMDVDYLRLSGLPSQGPTSVYELPAVTPRHTVFYAATPRPLGFKVDLNGHALSKTQVDGTAFAAVRRPFPSWPDSVYLEVPVSVLRDLGDGTHRLEFVMEDGSRAAAEVGVKAAAVKAPFTIVTFDIGHGKASLLALPDGEIVLVDTAKEAPAREVLVPFLQRHGIKRIDHLFITHYHEDHVGGLPYILPGFPGVPVYASTLARGLLGNKLKEHKLTSHPVLPFEPGDTLELGAFTAVGFRIGHSIPDAMGIALRTPVGTVVHTGDFKFDHTPVDGRLSDFHILARLGEEGVVCLLSDSTRAENPGYTPSERTVGEAFREIMEPLEGRVIVATFASNIARVQQVLDAAADFDRKVTVIGRSMEQNFRIAGDLGYLEYEKRLIVPKDQINTVPDEKLVIATTGAQGEPMAGLARMANRDHRFVEIKPGDTVILSASPIPGNEESVARTIDNLFKAGANVFYHAIKRAHVSGHASQEELKLMLGLTKPTYFMPMHGEFRMQVAHGKLAVETGVAPENVFIVENGQPVEIFPDGTARRGTPVTAGYVFVDGLSVGEVGEVVLRDRRALANDGMFMIDVAVDKQTGRVIGKPEIVTRGFIPDDSGRIIDQARERVIAAIENPGDHISEIGLLKTQIKDSVSRFLYEQTKRRPMVFPLVVEV